MAVRGIVPALVTAFDTRGELDPGRQVLLVERLIAQGVHALFAGGSTGEFPLLSGTERERLAETVIAAARHRVPVIVHAGSTETRESARLARHAVRAGADAVSCLPPFYYRISAGDVMRHFRTVAAAAEPLPFYAYHIPELTGVPMSPEILRGLLEIPNFAGLKWSDPDLFGLQQAVEEFGDRATVLSGKDEVLVAALALGAGGAIGSSYNFLAPWFVEMWESFQRGDLASARDRQAVANRVITRVIDGGPGPAPWKAAARWAGTDCGEPRPPLPALSPEERKAFEAKLESAGLPRGGLR